MTHKTVERVLFSNEQKWAIVMMAITIISNVLKLTFKLWACLVSGYSFQVLVQLLLNIKALNSKQYFNGYKKLQDLSRTMIHAQALAWKVV